MGSNFKVLFATAEASPLVKVGGLGDVAGSLTSVLHNAGHDVRLVMPRYGSINRGAYQAVRQGDFSLPFMGGKENIAVTQIMLKEGIPVYLLGNERYFGRQAVYGESDDLERFLLFSMAVMAVPKLLNWQPDILHCHDWHTAVATALLKFARRDDAFYTSCASVLTIHNLAYQGWFDDFFAKRAGLYDYLPLPGDPLRDRSYSMLSLGIYHSDVISTVSETYAREILTPEYGEKLDTLLSSRRGSLFGILNGIDYEQFDPEKDPLIAANYNINSLDRRVKNKLVLQEEVGLPVSTEIPIVAMVGRLADQKGLDITAEAMMELLPETDIQFILLGTGETRYQELLKLVESKNHNKARVLLTVDFRLAQLIFAGCDIFLTPSRFEPCGLTPLIGMRYGAIPVVRRTGGLAETTPDSSSDLQSGLGFVFERYEAGELLAAIKRALTAYQNKEGWRNLMIRAMKADFSWKASLPKYEALYEKARGKVLVQ